jgi:pimeloyl-ACP methyl ester carboxylesterase
MSATVIEGGLVHYEAFGRGKGVPILFIHGWLGSWRYWMATMEALAAIEHPVYALDLWGFGDSDKSKERFDLDSHRRLLIEFLSYLGLENPVLVGHALGAVVALECARLAPKLVHKIMAVSLPLDVASVSRRLVSFSSSSRMAKMLWRRQISFKEVRDEVEKAHDNAIKSSVDSLSSVDLRSNLKELSRPTLIVYGEKDDVVKPALMRNLNGSLSNVHHLGLTDAKHFPMLEDNAKFSRLLKDFIDLKGELSELTPKIEWRRRTH